MIDEPFVKFLLALLRNNVEERLLRVERWHFVARRVPSTTTSRRRRARRFDLPGRLGGGSRSLSSNHRDSVAGSLALALVLALELVEYFAALLSDRAIKAALRLSDDWRTRRVRGGRSWRQLGSHAHGGGRRLFAFEFVVTARHPDRFDGFLAPREELASGRINVEFPHALSDTFDVADSRGGERFRALDLRGRESRLGSRGRFELSGRSSRRGGDFFRLTTSCSLFGLCCTG